MRAKRVVIHTAREVVGIRAAAQAAARVRDELAAAVRPGMTTLALDALAAQLIAKTGGTSAFHGYRGFPGQVCISLGDEVVHGIGRADRVIGGGMIVSLDVGVNLGGFIGDTAISVWMPPNQDFRTRSLLQTTKRSLTAGIAAAKAGKRVNDIGRAVQKVVTAAGFSVVRDFVGHGCGCELHEPPEVPNFSQSCKGPRLRAGMVLAIEPMVNTGVHRVVVGHDGWTVRTADGGLSAHFEHMVLITRGKAEILTWPKIASS